LTPPPQLEEFDSNATHAVGTALTQRNRRPADAAGLARLLAQLCLPPSSLAMADIAELLRLVGAVRRLAFDRTLPASEALGRIRDALHDYDHPEAS
jgi:hypothetical protein